MVYSLRSAIKGSTVYTAGSLLTRATGFFLIPVYTRFLTPSDYGIIGLLNAIIMVVSPILTLGFAAAETRIYYDLGNDRRKIGELVFTLTTIIVVFSMVVCGALAVVGEPLFGLFLDLSAIPFHPFVLLTIGTLFLYVINQFVPSFYIAERRYTYTSILNISQFVLSAGFIIYFVVVSREGALGSVKGVLLGNAALFVLFFWYYARNFAWHFNGSFAKSGLALGLPIIVHATASAVMVTADRFVIDRYLTLGDVGLYSLGYKFGVMLSVITISANRAWIPNYYALMNQQDRDRAYEFRRVFVLWITIIGFLCIVGSLWAREIIMLMATRQYYGAGVVVPFVLVGYFFQSVYIFMIAPLFYFKRNIVISILSVTGAVVNLALNFLLVPRVGIVGAALSTIAAYLCIASAAWASGSRLFDPRFKVMRLVLLAGLAVATSIAGARDDLAVAIKVVAPAVYLIVCYALFPSYLGPMARKGLSLVRRRR